MRNAVNRVRLTDRDRKRGRRPGMLDFLLGLAQNAVITCTLPNSVAERLCNGSRNFLGGNVITER